jgi:CRISPR-associated endonuclease/helicase Cas3
MLDVGAVASCLLETDTWKLPSGIVGAAKPDLRRTIAALVALHDIGKFTRPFQGKAPELWPSALGPFAAPPAFPPHDTAGYWLLGDPRGIEPLRMFDRWLAGQRASVWRAIAGHHGRPPLEPHTQRVDRGIACKACLDAARAAADAIVATLKPAPLSPLADHDVARFAWWLAGLTVLADWIGSSQRWFPLVPAGDVRDLHAYWADHALPRAARAIGEAGLAPRRPAPATGTRALFPAIQRPTPLQIWAETVAIPDGPALFVIEDVTGAGKTEAALVLAHRLMRAGQAQGLFFALPTMATANAMYERLEAAYLRLFEPSASPSLVLAHGRRMLNERFRSSILDFAAKGGEAASDPADEPAGAQCAAWIADDRRKTFLADIGVGTIDQALLAVLPSRHAPLRLAGLSRQVLIVDEAHAYDAYMGEELATLLRFHAALGGSAIVLSATLTHKGRRKVAQAFASGIDAVNVVVQSDAYPLTTVVGRMALTETPCAMRSGLARSVQVERLADVETAVHRVAEAARAGAAVAWVRNAVDDVLEAAVALEAQGIAPIVFHARFAMGDRLAIEERVLSTFGPPDAASADRRGKVVVATQVIEQSLDLDFDVMVSDLAPSDLLIQRAGRLWRHRRDARPVPEPQMLLISPDPEEEIRADWVKRLLPRTSTVYRDDSLLWRSARAVLRAGVIITPGNIRALVEEAYDDEADGAVPEALSRSFEEAQGRRGVAIGIAWQNLLALDKPFQRDAGAWETDVRTPTRLEEQPHRVLRLARAEAGRVVPWCEHADPRHAWALSEVSVPVSRVAGVAEESALAASIAAVKSSWGRWEQEIPLLVLQPDDLASVGIIRTPRGEPAPLRYDRRSGLRFRGA